MQKEVNQSKQVYLFELDSVRKTDLEIEIGQKALYHEIVDNGNTVVLTYNQLVDSRAFFSLLTDHNENKGKKKTGKRKNCPGSNYRQSFIELFKNGAIRVSQFGDIRTVSQYIQRSVEDDKHFIYSALPMKYQQKRLTAIVERSLRYSDLTEIQRYIDNKGEDARKNCQLLFAESIDGREVESTLTYEEEIRILENLKNFLSTILRISAMTEIYVPPRDPEEYRDLHLPQILNLALDIQANDTSYSQYFTDAVNLIRQLSCFQEANENRSLYHEEIRKKALENRKKALENSSSENQAEMEIYQLAEAIIDISYNYACEISICNISKHYDFEGLKNRNNLSSFQNDFKKRLEESRNTGKDRTKRFLQEDTNAFFFYEYNPKEIPDFSKAVRLTTYLKKDRIKVKNAQDSAEKQEKYPEYETNLNRQMSCLREKLLGFIHKNLFLALSCILIVCIADFLVNTLQSAYEGSFDVRGSLLSIPENILFLAFSEILTVFLSKIYPNIKSLSESMSLIETSLRDRLQLFRPSKEGYVNTEHLEENSFEIVNREKRINYVLPLSLRKYIKLYKKEGTGNSNGLFNATRLYPIADVTNPSVQEALMRDSEIHNRQYGIVYESQYHQMLADPIVSLEKSAETEEEEVYYNYERIVTTTRKSGVVAITYCQGKYILLCQERHAIRKKQYAFPRGFADKTDPSGLDSIKRELKEELNAVMHDEPIYLGQIVPDSGLASSSAEVYYTNLDSYEEKCDYEGIEKVRAVTEEELQDMISNGIIDDGFTLAAMELYSSRLK